MSKKQQRKNLMDLEPSPTEPDPIVQAIAAPEAGVHLRRRPAKRNRKWERVNRTRSYKIPRAFHARARAVREALVGLAQQYQTTADDVASALMASALAAVQEGEIQLDYRPNPQGRKMTVEITREEGWPQKELPKPRKKKAVKPLWLGFRFSEEIANTITRLAGDAPKGAVVVLLLEAALERVKAGKWGLRPRPVEVKQTVEVASFVEKSRAKRAW